MLFLDAQDATGSSADDNQVDYEKIQKKLRDAQINSRINFKNSDLDNINSSTAGSAQQSNENETQKKVSQKTKDALDEILKKRIVDLNRQASSDTSGNGINSPANGSDQTAKVEPQSESSNEMDEANNNDTGSVKKVKQASSDSESPSSSVAPSAESEDLEGLERGLNVGSEKNLNNDNLSPSGTGADKTLSGGESTSSEDEQLNQSGPDGEKSGQDNFKNESGSIKPTQSGANKLASKPDRSDINQRNKGLPNNLDGLSSSFGNQGSKNPAGKPGALPLSGGSPVANPVAPPPKSGVASATSGVKNPENIKSSFGNGAKDSVGKGGVDPRQLLANQLDEKLKLGTKIGTLLFMIWTTLAVVTSIAGFLVVGLPFILVMTMLLIWPRGVYLLTELILDFVGVGEILQIADQAGIKKIKIVIKPWQKFIIVAVDVLYVIAIILAITLIVYMVCGSINTNTGTGIVTWVILKGYDIYNGTDFSSYTEVCNQISASLN